MNDWLRFGYFVGSLLCTHLAWAECLEVRTEQRHIHIAKIDLNCPNIQIVGTEISERGSTVSEFARRHRTSVAINGGFFRTQYLPFGLTVTQGQVWPRSRDLRTRTFFACDRTNRCMIETGNTESILDKSWHTVISGWQFFNRETVQFECADQDAAAACQGIKFVTRQPRTMLGMNAANQLFLVVVDGRRRDFQGMTLDELAKLAQKLNLQQAINLDGGGSSTMVVDNSRRSVLPDRQPQERVVANHLGIVLLPD